MTLVPAIAVLPGTDKEGLTLAQLAPGPMAAQLAIYLGYVHFRLLGATLVGIAFVIPSFLMVVALGWAYAHFGGLSWTQAVFYGVGAAVVGIIAAVGAVNARHECVASGREGRLSRFHPGDHGRIVRRW